VNARECPLDGRTCAAKRPAKQIRECSQNTDGHQVAGAMFWFTRKTFSGSYLAFTCRSRA
jgi:hypothetical protein